MIKLKGSLVPEEEFYCTTLRDAARILNVIGLLARVYGRPEPLRFLGILGRSLVGGRSPSLPVAPRNGDPPG